MERGVTQRLWLGIYLWVARGCRIDRYSKNLNLWEQKLDAQSFLLHKRVIEEINNGVFTKENQDYLWLFLGDSPETLYFMGKVSEMLRLKWWEKGIERSVSMLNNAIVAQKSCDSLIEILSSSSENYLSAIAPWPSMERDSKLYFDSESTIKNLLAIKLNCESLIFRDPHTPLVEKRRGKRINMRIRAFVWHLISAYCTVYKRYPKFSETSSDHNAFDLICEIYGYMASDKLKEFKLMAREYKKQTTPPVEKG